MKWQYYTVKKCKIIIESIKRLEYLPPDSRVSQFLSVEGSRVGKIMQNIRKEIIKIKDQKFQLDIMYVVGELDKLAYYYGRIKLGKYASALNYSQDFQHIRECMMEVYKREIKSYSKKRVKRIESDFLYKNFFEGLSDEPPTN